MIDGWLTARLTERASSIRRLAGHCVALEPDLGTIDPQRTRAGGSRAEALGYTSRRNIGRLAVDQDRFER
jgi:hypothetical protein